MRLTHILLLVVIVTIAKTVVYVAYPPLGDALQRHPLYSTATEGRRDVLELGPMTPLHGVAALPSNTHVAFGVSNAMECLTALALHQAAAPRHAATVVALYVLNPIMLAEPFSLSLSPLPHLLAATLLLVVKRDAGTPPRTTVYTAVFLVAMLATWNILYAVLYSVAFLACGTKLQYAICTVVVALQMAASSTWGFGVPSTPDVTPNFGLYWYFFQLMFAPFRTLYTYLFASMPFVYVVPLAAKLQGLPSAPRAMVLIGVLHAIANYHTLSPTLPSLFFSYHLLHAADATACNTQRYVFPFLGLVSASTVMGHVYLYSWLVLRRTNANFFYFSTLAFAVAFLLFLTQFLTRVIVAHRETLVAKEK